MSALDLPVKYHYIALVFATLTVAGIVWGILGFPIYTEHKDITILSATTTYISPTLFGPIDCKITDTSESAYYLRQDFDSKYWCIQGWNRTEEIHPGQLYKIEISRGLFGYSIPLYTHTPLPEIVKMERIDPEMIAEDRMIERAKE